MDRYRSGIGDGPQTSDADVLRQAKSIVDDYLAYLADHPVHDDVIDAAELPGARDTLVSCFRLLIATESRPAVRKQLRIVGLTLAHFQTEVGERMSMQPVEMESKLPDGQVELLMQSHRADIERFDRAYRAIAQERTRLDRLFQHSMQTAEARHPEQAANRPMAPASGIYH